MASPFPLDLYSVLRHQWPSSGRHILAHYTQDQIVLYQAYNKSIGQPAVQHQDFITSNPGFSLSRMTWIKPNFLWMMYRSGWGTKANQEVTLAISVSRPWFDEVLAYKAVLSTKGAKNEQKAEVVVQWDPDHDPFGNKETRRALQVGLRGDVAQEFARGVKGPAIVAIHDVSDFVKMMKTEVLDRGLTEQELRMPVERVYPVSDEIRSRLEM